MPRATTRTAHGRERPRSTAPTLTSTPGVSMRHRLLTATLTLTLAAAAAAGCDRPGPPPPETTEAEAEFTTSSLTEGLDLPFSETARVGDLLFLSGMVGIEPGALELVSGGLEAESRRALENIRLMLEGAGATPDDVLKCTVMLDDMSRWSDFNEIYVEFFGDHRPARSAFGTDGLALDAAVEIECVAAVGGA